MIKKIKSYFLVLSVLGLVLLPLSTEANLSLGLDSKTNLDVDVSSKSESGERKEGLKLEVKNQVNASADADKSSRNDDDSKFSNKFESKNNVDVKVNNNNGKDKDNEPRRFDWFLKFFNKNKNEVKVFGVHVVKGATTTATVNWDSNVKTAGKVYFSSDPALLVGTTTASFVADNNLSTKHSVVLSGLSLDTKYYYFVEYRDENNNVLRTKIRKFETKSADEIDVSGPKILFVTALKKSGVSSNIIWLTDEASNAKVWVSEKSPVDTTASPTASSVSVSIFHSLSLSNLATSTKYFYVVSSTDASGNITLSSENSFETKAN